MIYLVRHGQTEFNRIGRLQGHVDSPLTPLGIDQATRVGALLKSLIGDPAGWTLEASSLGRAVHTAKIIAEATGVGDIVLEDRLREVSMGSWDGLTVEEIAVLAPQAVETAKRSTLLFQSPDGETYDVMCARLRSWLDAALADGRPRIVVSHGISGRGLRALYAGLDWEAAAALPAPQDAIFRLDGGRIERIDCESAPLASA
ncbi:MAG TPA: histidine phosphatase family protein [Caulobacteraceae bacterium]|jgi:probable phosphoglycerate mutase|nr:histidine phosphatase family protein [Caulobacteraceae bacterium]